MLLTPKILQQMTCYFHTGADGMFDCDHAQNSGLNEGIREVVKTY